MVKVQKLNKPIIESVNDDLKNDEDKVYDAYMKKMMKLQYVKERKEKQLKKDDGNNLITKLIKRNSRLKFNPINADEYFTKYKKNIKNDPYLNYLSLPKKAETQKKTHNNKIVKVQAQYTVEFKLENTGIIRESEMVAYDPEYPVSVEVAENAEEYADEAVPFAVVEQIPLLGACKNVEKKNK
jgi:hypothetical protein